MSDPKNFTDPNLEQIVFLFNDLAVNSGDNTKLTAYKLDMAYQDIARQEAAIQIGSVIVPDNIEGLQ